MTVPQYARIHVAGPDAFEFLQGQLSNDLRRLTAESRLLAAWCNPKGRVITLLRVAGLAEGYALDLPAELVDDVVKRLTLFRFRAKVTFASNMLPASELAGASNDSLREWQLSNLQNGVVEIGVAQSEKYTPHMLNLDLVDAISLDKGCYTGQEIVARTHFRGASRRRLLHFTSEIAANIGDEIYDTERKVGDVVNAIDNELLAVLPVDAVDSTLTIEGLTLHRAALPYSIA